MFICSFSKALFLNLAKNDIYIYTSILKFLQENIKTNKSI